MDSKSSKINYLAVIPARGGSKRIPRKNIVFLGKKPLIVYTIDAALKSRKIARTVVSTDNEEIAAVAKQYGAEVPFMRPSRIAQDKSSLVEVLEHALKKMEVKGQKFNAVILLQPTSPFRDAKNIDEAINLFEKTEADTVTAVSYPDESPYYAWRIRDNELISLFPIKYQNMPREKHPITVMENGAIYIIKREIVLTKKIYGEKVVPYIMDREKSLNIDELIDLQWAEFLLNQKSK